MFGLRNICEVLSHYRQLKKRLIIPLLNIPADWSLVKIDFFYGLLMLNSFPKRDFLEILYVYITRRWAQIFD